jgi:DNA polymerase-3 subunit delta'
MSDAERNVAPGALPWPPSLPWQDTFAREALAHRERWPHALLIHGRRGMGKHALGLRFAQALLCEVPRSDRLACGECPGCRYAIAGQHPDLMRLELQVLDPDSGELEPVDTIAVDRIRALIDFVQLSSHRQRAKVAVIAPADRMNAAAANALLKTLEEPPAGTYLILVSDQPARLPPTILSRCRKLAAPQPSEAEALAWLAAQGLAEPAPALAQAGGAPLDALQHADAGVAAERRQWLAALSEPRTLGAMELAARIDAGGKGERKDRLAHAVEWLLAWTADLARVNAGGQARLNPDAATALARLAPRVAPVRLFRYHRSLLAQRALLAHPLSPRLAAEALLIDYQALFD